MARRVWTLVALITLLVSLSSFKPPQANAASGTLNIRRTTSNLYYKTSERQTKADIAKVTAVSDVIGFQEVAYAHHRNALNDLTSQGWAVYMPSGCKQDAIAWRSDKFKVLEKHSYYIHSTGFTLPICANTVVLQDRNSSFTVGIVNSHAIPGAYTGHPERKGKWLEWEARMKSLTLDLAKDHTIVLGSADGNRHNWPLTWAEKHTASRGTFAGAYYDVIWSKSNQRQAPCSVKSAKTLSTNSDHNTLEVSFGCTVEKENKPGSNARAGTSSASSSSSSSPAVVVDPARANDCKSADKCEVFDLIILITNGLSGIAVLIIIMMVVAGGIQYSAAGPNPSKVQAARTKIFNALLALALFIFGYSILQWLIPGGIF